MTGAVGPNGHFFLRVALFSVRQETWAPAEREERDGQRGLGGQGMVGTRGLAWRPRFTVRCFSVIDWVFQPHSVLGKDAGQSKWEAGFNQGWSFAGGVQ